MYTYTHLECGCAACVRVGARVRVCRVTRFALFFPSTQPCVFSWSIIISVIIHPQEEQETAKTKNHQRTKCARTCETTQQTARVWRSGPLLRHGLEMLLFIPESYFYPSV